MKIIDLLNKIANEEEVPKKIKYSGVIYEYRDYTYCNPNVNKSDIDYYLFSKWNFLILNDEVEILEEKKIPEKLNKQHFHKKQRQLANKMNEIIGYLEYLKSKGE